MAGFPLFRLPNNNTIRVVQYMEKYDLLALSFAFKQVKSLMTSLNCGAKFKFGLFIREKCIVLDAANADDSRDVKLRVRNHENQSSALYTDSLSKGMIVEPRDLFRGVQDRWTLSEYGYKDVFDHFRQVFCMEDTNVQFLQFHGVITELDALKATIGRVSSLDIGELVPVDYARKLLETFFAEKDVTIMSKDVLGDQLERYAICNYNVFNLGSIHSTIHFTLDQLLMTNAVMIHMVLESPSAEMFNRFFKSWITGRHNRRLRQMNMLTRFGGVEMKTEDILKGIHYVSVPENTRRWFENDLEIKGNPSHGIVGGYDIRSRNGTKATIVIEYKAMAIEFYVWD